MEKKEKKAFSMKGSIKDSIKEMGLPKILMMALAGILLLVFSVPQKPQPKEAKEGESEEKIRENDAYIAAMESKLEETLKQIDGVGNVEVMLTLETSKETVLNKDTQKEQEKMREDEKTNDIVKQSEETIVTENGGNEQPYIIKEIEPKVAGVIAVVEGGGNPVVVKEVTEAVSVLFHLEVNKIKVLKMEVKK